MYDGSLKTGRCLRLTHVTCVDLTVIVTCLCIQVDSDLACMMARGSAVAVSESNYDANEKDSGADNERFRSASEVGSTKDDEPPADDLGPIRSNDASAGRARSNGAIDVCGDDTASASVISSLTMTTDDTASASVVSSLTMPTLSAPSKRSGSVVSSAVSLRSALDRTRRAISRARGPPPALQEDESGSGLSSAGCDSSSLDRYVSKVLLQYVVGQGQSEHEQGQPQPTTTTSESESLESIRLELAALVVEAGPPAPAVTSGVLKCDATSDATKK